MLVLLNKPFQVMCQFTDDQGRQTLADFVKIKNVYAAGRLDFDSEGLLLLTDEGRFANKMADPKFKTEKTYFAQVEGGASEPALESLRQGVQLNDGPTRPATVQLIGDDPDWLWPRTPPIRFRQNIPTTWIALTIAEGRNRQVRRMTAAVGLPCLRLIRTRIGPYRLDGLMPGQTRILEHALY